MDEGPTITALLQNLGSGLYLGFILQPKLRVNIWFFCTEWVKTALLQCRVIGRRLANIHDTLFPSWKRGGERRVDACAYLQGGGLGMLGMRAEPPCWWDMGLFEGPRNILKDWYDQLWKLPNALTNGWIVNIVLSMFFVNIFILYNYVDS